MKIRIIKTPKEGPCPDDIKLAWLGINLEAICKQEPRALTDADMLTGETSHQKGGYRVAGATALKTLRIHNYTAYRWWLKNSPNILRQEILFPVEVCKEIG